MKNMIEELYYGNLDLTLLRPKLDSEYCKKHREINELLKKLDPYITKEDAIALHDNIISLEEIVGRSYFVIGFQWGAKLLMSVFDYEPDMFTFQND